MPASIRVDGISVFCINNITHAQLIRYNNSLSIIPIGDACPQVPANANIIGSGNDPRLFVATDARGAVPDDKQSLMHLLKFADKVEVKGFSTAAMPSNNSQLDELDYHGHTCPISFHNH